jgi:hypothetical protein
MTMPNNTVRADATGLPDDIYGLHCVEPIGFLQLGDVALASPSATLKIGGLVVVYLTSGAWRILKLEVAPPPNWPSPPEGDAQPIIGVSREVPQDPDRPVMVLDGRQVAKIHAVVGRILPTGDTEKVLQ